MVIICAEFIGAYSKQIVSALLLRIEPAGPSRQQVSVKRPPNISVPCASSTMYSKYCAYAVLSPGLYNKGMLYTPLNNRVYIYSVISQLIQHRYKCSIRPEWQSVHMFCYLPAYTRYACSIHPLNYRAYVCSITNYSSIIIQHLYALYAPKLWNRRMLFSHHQI